MSFSCKHRSQGSVPGQGRVLLSTVVKVEKARAWTRLRLCVCKRSNCMHKHLVCTGKFGFNMHSQAPWSNITVSMYAHANLWKFVLKHPLDSRVYPSRSQSNFSVCTCHEVPPRQKSGRANFVLSFFFGWTGKGLELEMLVIWELRTALEHWDEMPLQQTQRRQPSSFEELT